MNKTFMANTNNIEHNWYLVNAAGKTLGRLAAEIAKRLRGKHKTTYTPHADTGDYIVVVNAADIRVTGNKTDAKTYYHHTGYPGGIKSESFNKLQARQPERILMLAVKGMLPKGPLGRQMLKKLRVFAHAQHTHEAQQPQPLDLA